MNFNKAIENLTHELGLPLADRFTQDWAYELPDDFRTHQYFERYLDSYSKPTRSDSEKKVLMELMMDIANDSVAKGEKWADEAWLRLERFLQNEHVLHRGLIAYWSLDGESLEDAFPLTARVRALRGLE